MSKLPSVSALLSGSIFGAALTAASVYPPLVILDQLALKDLHMLKVFLTASACSAVIVYAANKVGFASLTHRRNTTLGLFGAYDANVVGGLLQGLGMALTGACPGTVFVQVALGGAQAVKVLIGGVLGGLGYVFVVQPFFKPRDGQSKHTVQERLKVSGETALLGYEALMVGIVAAVDRSGLGASGARYPIRAVYGGLLIGAAQASSVLLSKKTLGVSSAFAQVAEHVKGLTTGSKGSGTGWANILFAIGVMGGANVASQRVAGLPAPSVELGTAAAVLGGFSSILGARIAGGCTSGHGISGMSTLSVSSFVTVAAMFGGGIAFKLALDAM